MYTGSTADEYAFIYINGTTETYQLKICSSALLHKVTRIDFRIFDADLLIKIIIYANYEIYQINYRSIAAAAVINDNIMELLNDI
ncbi:MAG: hypothetical protein ACYCWE_09815 [Eubacteriales bacterium]